VHNARISIVDPIDYPLAVLLPVREVAFDTRNEANEFNMFVLGRVDPRQFMKDTDFQITYGFSTRRRTANPFRLGGGSYGAPNVTFRQLYDLLCTVYNDGERFIDTYFQRVFPGSQAGREFAAFEGMVRSAMRQEWLDRYTAALARRQTKAGLLHKATERKLLREFSVWKSDLVASTLKRLERNIRQEIIAKLSTGGIPLQHKNTAITKNARAELNIPREPEFFATGQLVRDIQIDIRIPEEAFA
jgi:hypothetical protein